MFEAGIASVFFAAFGNYFFWIIFLIVRNLSYYIIEAHRQK